MTTWFSTIAELKKQQVKNYEGNNPRYSIPNLGILDINSEVEHH